METNNLKSPFQLIDNRIEKLNIKNDLINLEDKNLIHEISNIDYKIGEVAEINDEYWGVLQLLLDLKIKKSRKIVYSLSLVVEGAFKGDSKFLGREKFEEMLELNGTSSLYSIARSIITTVSSLSLISGQIRIPMLNIMSLYQTKHQNAKLDKTRNGSKPSESGNNQ
ncbi:MAG TPA: hypothetical protein VHO66_09740 [Ruminiclostridium sp.]|nr:hypothetical protein [Ruminiclostridium sp.]